MNIFSIPSQLHTVPAADRIIAVGVFDGVHIGHRVVLSRALMEHGLSPAVLTFSNAEIFKGGGQLQTDEARCALLEQLEFADVFQADFTAVKNMSPAAFISMLKNDLGAKAIVCGFNFHFGKDGAGNTETLQTLCEENDIVLYVQPAVQVDGVAVSSSRIKQALSNGDMQTVLQLLNNPFTIDTIVQDGQHLGRTLGAPTINQTLESNLALPRFGVYASIAIINEKAYPAITNIGVRPTVGSEQPLAETYILDFGQDVYGERIQVQLLHFLRAEQQFDSVDALQSQIEADISAVRDFFAAKSAEQPRAILFDFDNTLQDRQIAFLLCLQDFIRALLPSLCEDEILKYADILLNTAEFGFVPYKKVFEKAAEVLPLTEPLDFDAAYAFLKIAYPLHTTLFADAVNTLLELKRRGYRIGMLTNGVSRIQNCKVDMSGLRPMMDYVMVSGDEHLQKPDPEPFYRLAYRLGVHPSECVYVGDNPVNDIEGALSAGMKAVFRDFSYPGIAVENPAVPHIRELADLLDLCP